jgi:hypothetical protein
MPWIFVLLALTLSGCGANVNSNYSEAATSWRFAPANQLVRSWGAPSQEVSLPNGNKVLIYSKESYRSYPVASFNTPTMAVSQNGTVIMQPPNPTASPTTAEYLLRCITTFEVDPHNVIVDVRAQGNNCSGDSGFLMGRSNPTPVTHPAT